MTDLRINEIEVFRFDIRMREPFRIATMVTDSAPNVLVCIRAGGDLYGWGEASPLHSIAGETQATCLAAAGELRPLLLGRNPLEIGALVREMEHFLPHNATIRSAFDMALHDLAAKAAGLPLYRLLGGRHRRMETDLTLGIGDPASAGEKARSFVERGFRILKVKIGTHHDEDVARVRSIREAVGPHVRIRIDGNQGYDRVGAAQVLQALERFDIEFCEQPVRAEDIRGLRQVGALTSIPLMADEALFTPADALRLVEAEAAPYFNIKLSKSGGIHTALRIAAIAEAAGIRCMAGCMLESRLGLAAAAHFARAAEAVHFYDLDTCFEQAEEPILGGIEADNGILALPELPGLGAEPNPETLARLERAV
jgi:L-alanine-DL-glutamate epimerase-like enolase superfamily enzyme